MKKHLLLFSLMSISFFLSGCGEPDNSLSANTPIIFNGGFIIVNRFISNSDWGHESIDRKTSNVMGVEFGYTQNSDVGPENLDVALANCFLMDKDGTKFPGIRVLATNTTIIGTDNLEQNQLNILLVFGVPKNTRTSDLKLKVGDSILKLPKPE
ncbi:MAG: hypothetical protein LBQ12_07685 [Deltaproteobacteria bacterium]|jgi:hypothetical protein|nr:hypothetical protein [Deltaproteobacteria bacterium]